jgi:hypothetical protein
MRRSLEHPTDHFAGLNSVPGQPAGRPIRIGMGTAQAIDDLSTDNYSPAIDGRR